MLEMIVLGLTIVIGMVLASLAMLVITFKIMLSKKWMLWFVKKYMKMINEITEEVTEDLLKVEAE